MPVTLRGMSSAEATPVAPPAPAEKPKETYNWGNWLKNPLNELEWLGKKAINEVKYGYNTVKEQVNAGGQSYGGVGTLRLQRRPDGRLAPLTANPASVNAVKGVQSAITEGIKQVSLMTPPRESVGPITGRIFEAIRTGADKLDEYADEYTARALGIKPDYAAADKDLLTRGLGQFATQTALSSAVAARAIQGSNLSPWAKAALGFVAEEGTASLIADPYRDGSLFDLFGGPAAIQPTDPVMLAKVKKLSGDLTAAGFMSTPFALLDKMTNIKRATRESAAAVEVDDARRWTEDNGIQIKNNDGEYEFTPEAQETEVPEGFGAKLDLFEDDAPAAREIPSDPMEPGGAVTPASLLDGDPAVDPWDPAAPEVETVVRALDRLDDEGMARVAEADRVVEPTELELDVDAPEGIEVPVALAATQRSTLANPIVPYAEQFERLPNDQLLSLAHPENSQELYEKTVLMTGKDYAEFTRPDVLKALQALSDADGVQILPNRVAVGAQIMDVNDISVDPQRFQFKQGVSDKGVQKGQSLSGVDRWNTDLEDVIDVWQDPANGKIYVVNGHNRLDKARKLGVPSLPVNFLTARTAEQARAVGAVKNIGQGAGTAFDAAKFIRDQGLDEEGLKAAGLPLKSGLARDGLALSKLPPAIFQDAVDGVMPLKQAVKLGESGLSDEQMLRLRSLMGDRNFSDVQFSEMVDMAGSAPRVESDQINLFGTETMDTIAIKADLAARIRSSLTSDKNLFKRVGKDKSASKLAAADTTVNQARVQETAAAAEAALGNFDAEKYAAGTTLSRLLNEGTEEIANGAKPKVVADRITRQIADASEAAPPPKVQPDPQEAEVAPPREPMDFETRYGDLPEDRLATMRDEADQYLLTDRKRKNRQKLVEADKANNELVEQYIKEAPGSNVPEELTEEAFIAKYGLDESAHPQLFKDRKYKKAKEELEREQWANEYIKWYDSRTPVQMTAQGRNELKKKIIKKAIANREVKPSQQEVVSAAPGQSMEELAKNPDGMLAQEVELADNYAAKDAAVAEAQARAEREASGYYDKTLEQNLDEGLMDQFPDDPEPPAFPEPEGEPSYQLPADVAKSKPRYGMATVQFGNDLDRAAYIIRSKAKKSKGEDRIIKSLEDQGFDVDAVRVHGSKVKHAIGNRVEELTGSRRAPQEAVEVDVQPVPFENPKVLMSVADNPDYPDFFRTDSAGLRSEIDATKLAIAVEDEIKRIVGPDILNRANAVLEQAAERKIPAAHGGEERVGRPGGWYNYATDMIRVFDMTGVTVGEAFQTAWHESWHRIQHQFLTPAEMRILNTGFAKAKIDNLMPLYERAKGKATIEKQAYAFQIYADYRDKGLSPMAARQAALRDNAGMASIVQAKSGWALQRGVTAKMDMVLDALDAVADSKVGEIWQKMMFKLFNIYEALTNFAKGNGFQTFEDVFEAAFTGQMASRRKIYEAKRLLRDASTKGDKMMRRMIKRMMDAEERTEILDIWQIDNDPVALAAYLDAANNALENKKQALMSQAAAEGC